MKVGLFDSEFNSASNGDTFIDGKTVGKNFPWIFVLSPIHVYVTIYEIQERVLVLQTVFPSMKMGPFDSEFNSASNGDTLIDGKTVGKNFPWIFVLSPIHVYVTIYEIQETVLVLQTVFPSMKLGPFDSEFNSASNGDTFIDGKTVGKNFPRNFFLSLIH